MAKSIIIISVVVLAYLGFWYLNVQESRKPPAKEPLETQKSVDSVLQKDVKSPEVLSPEAQKSLDSTDSKNQAKNTLDLSNQGLDKMPGYVLDMKNLTELDLSGNALTGALPAEIRHLTNLEKLDVSNNQMTGIPAEVGQLKKLQELDYSNNQITGLPLEIGNLKNLKILNLSGNDYAEIDLEKIKGSLPGLKVVTD